MTTRGIRVWAMPLVALLLGASGCSNTVRYLTPMRWITASAAPTAAAASGAPAAPADGVRTLYVTYWEGSCSAGFFGIGKGCSLGDSKIRRCNLRPDNQFDCVDEIEATRAFARQK